MTTKRRSCWPYLLLFKSKDIWVCEAECCNVVGYGGTMQEAYQNWYEWYRMPF